MRDAAEVVDDGAEVMDEQMETGGDEDGLDDMILNLMRDPNTDDMQDVLDHSFWQDLHADEWESDQMDNVNVELVTAAKQAELRQLAQRSTMEIVDRSSLDKSVPIVGTKWVCTNKGSAEEPRIKARLVCQEFATQRLGPFQRNPDPADRQVPPSRSGFEHEGSSGDAHGRDRSVPVRTDETAGRCETAGGTWSRKREGGTPEEVPLRAA